MFTPSASDDRSADDTILMSAPNEWNDNHGHRIYAETPGFGAIRAQISA